jgi:hypothetical protein
MLPDKMSPDKMSPDKMSPYKMLPDKMSPDKMSPDKMLPMAECRLGFTTLVKMSPPNVEKRSKTDAILASFGTSVINDKNRIYYTLPNLTRGNNYGLSSPNACSGLSGPEL